MNSITGRGGAIAFERSLREDMLDAPDVDTSVFRYGVYTIGIDGCTYNGYYTDEQDGIYVRQEQGRYYIDRVKDGFGSQVEKISEEQFNKLMQEQNINALYKTT